MSDTAKHKKLGYLQNSDNMSLLKHPLLFIMNHIKMETENVWNKHLISVLGQLLDVVCHKLNLASSHLLTDEFKWNLRIKIGKILQSEINSKNSSVDVRGLDKCKEDKGKPTHYIEVRVWGGAPTDERKMIEEGSWICDGMSMPNMGICGLNKL